MIVIMADDLGYGDISPYGGWIETPQLERLAAQGLLFADFHTSGSSCSPTRAGLLTGRYQQRAGLSKVLFDNDQHPTHYQGLRAVENTLAEGLRTAGYATAIFGKWHLGYLPEFNSIPLAARPTSAVPTGKWCRRWTRASGRSLRHWTGST